MKKLLCLLAIASMLVLSGCASSPASGTPAASTPAPEPSVKTYKAGMYKVGSDIPAGEYVLVSSDLSYFAVQKNSTGDFDSIITNDNFVGRSIVSVKDGQYLTMTGSKAYAFADAPKAKPVDGYLPAGMYKVGVDLPAGEYKIVPDGTGYLEVSNKSFHLTGDIVTNDIFEAERYITVKAGQYLKVNDARIKLK